MRGPNNEMNSPELTRLRWINKLRRILTEISELPVEDVSNHSVARLIMSFGWRLTERNVNDGDRENPRRQRLRNNRNGDMPRGVNQQYRPDECQSNRPGPSLQPHPRAVLVGTGYSSNYDHGLSNGWQHYTDHNYQNDYQGPYNDQHYRARTWHGNRLVAYRANPNGQRPNVHVTIVHGPPNMLPSIQMYVAGVDLSREYEPVIAHIIEQVFRIINAEQQIVQRDYWDEMIDEFETNSSDDGF